MVSAIAGHIGDATERFKDAEAAQAYEDYRRLIAAFADAPILTTNWDTVIDRLLWGVDPQAPADWRPNGRRVCYTPIAEEIVDPTGRKIDWSDAPQTHPTTFLKLHGSLNWPLLRPL